MINSILNKKIPQKKVTSCTWHNASTIPKHHRSILHQGLQYTGHMSRCFISFIDNQHMTKLNCTNLKGNRTKYKGESLVSWASWLWCQWESETRKCSVKLTCFEVTYHQAIDLIPMPIQHDCLPMASLHKWSLHPEHLAEE